VVTQTGKKDINLATLMSSYPTWAHPSVHYHARDWEKLRDTFQGEREVKEKGGVYLPRPSGLDDEEFAFYIDNATYFNMTNRTVGALTGTIFRRNPVIENLPEKLKDKLKRITKDAQSLRSFTRLTAKEVIHMGRYGVLVDMGRDGGDPYLTGYVTEAILDWTTGVVGDREVLTEVILMEAVLQPHTTVVKGSRGKTQMTVMNRGYSVRIRALRLVDGIYQQHIYDSLATETYPDITRDPTDIITPTNRGAKLNYIPFMIFGAEGNSAGINRSPMLDITQMNLSHYRSYAHLEHGRWYTATPVYWASKATTDRPGEYTLGASVVWELSAGESAGVIEFNGNGLKFLENAIETKEAHIATLGGRVIGVTTSSVSESDNQVAMKDRNEQALLLNVSLSLDEGFTKVLQWWATWQDVKIADAEKIAVEFNKDFMLSAAAAREFRAIQQMYDDGLLPIEVVYDYLKRAEVIPDWMDIEEFKKLLASKQSFINNPDVHANQRGMPDRKSELKDLTETQAALDLKAARQQQDHQSKLAKENAKATAAAAKIAAKSQPEPGKPAPSAK
jgi:hypothetical protein